jgi:hypothetical protein
MSHDLVTYLLKKVREEIAAVETSLARGGAKDFAEYRHSCGTVHGLNKTLSMLLELEKRMEIDSDD